MGQLVESKEELDESEREPVDRVSDQLIKSASWTRRVRSEDGNPKSGTSATIYASYSLH